VKKYHHDDTFHQGIASICSIFYDIVEAEDIDFDASENIQRMKELFMLIFPLLGSDPPDGDDELILMGVALLSTIFSICLQLSQFLHHSFQMH